ncbi:MAG: glycosyltransferase family 39 protein [Ignavibacteriaceae bacterium]|nr:glycosyltransferase family 39 protein [Ignavibacteriaceae bacterium]
MKIIIQHKYFILICILLGLLIRLAWIIFFDIEPVSDFHWYYTSAQRIALGRGYIGANGPTAYFPVGYPAFLGLVFYFFEQGILIAQIVNIILYETIIILTYLSYKIIFTSEIGARISVVLLTFYPNHIAYSSLIASETFFLFLCMLGSYLFLISKSRSLFLVASGIAFGLATLTKPWSFFLFIILLFCSSKNFYQYLKTFLILFITQIIVISPWLIRNHSAFGRYTLSNNFGVNLLVGNSYYSKGKFTNEPVYKYSDLKSTNNERIRDSVAFSIALNFIRNYPFDVFKLLPKKLWYLWYKDVEGIGWNIEGLKNTNSLKLIILKILKLPSQLFYLILLFVYIFSFRQLYLRFNSKFVLLGLYSILYISIISLIFFGDARFHFHVIPYIVLTVSLYFEKVLEDIRIEIF